MTEDTGEAELKKIPVRIPQWTYCKSGEYEKRLKAFSKTHRAETQNCVANFNRYFDELNAGHKPQHISRGFLHSEQAGVLAIDQSGPHQTKLKALRLYVYPDEATATLYVLTIGDKSTQKDDVKRCAVEVRSLIKERDDKNKK